MESWAAVCKILSQEKLFHLIPSQSAKQKLAEEHTSKTAKFYRSQG